MLFYKFTKENKTWISGLNPRRTSCGEKNRGSQTKSGMSNVSKGFTLIELLVSIALFSIVIVIILGAVLTITDANRKARSLMTVMNNLNFSVDAMTRSFKTGDNPSDSVLNTCFQTSEIDYRAPGGDSAATATTRVVRYCWDDGEGKITKQVGSTISDLTSPDINITSATFDVRTRDTNKQPLLFINLQGEVQAGTVTSAFTIQTAVSQSKLEI